MKNGEKGRTVKKGEKGGEEKFFLNKKTHPLLKNATKRIKQVHIVPIDYQLKKRCFLIKGCAATIVFGPLIFQNINRLSDMR